MVEESDEPGRPEPRGDPLARLLKERIVVLGQQLDDAVAERVVMHLGYLDLEDPGQDISLYLNSPGGAVEAGMAVLDAMGRARAEVRTYGMGLAGGFASLLLAAGAPGKRFLLPHSRVHLAAPRPGEPVTPAERDRLARYTDDVIGRYARATGRPADRIAADLAAGTWLDPEQAVAYGLADAVIGKG